MVTTELEERVVAIYLCTHQPDRRMHNNNRISRVRSRSGLIHGTVNNKWGNQPSQFERLLNQLQTTLMYWNSSSSLLISISSRTKQQENCKEMQNYCYAPPIPILQCSRM